MLSKSEIKYIQTLGQKKFREEEKRFIAEGPKLVAELLQSHNTIISEVFALPEWITAHEKLLGKVSCHAITDIELEKISQLVTPNKVLAIVQQWDEKETITAKGKIVLALDDIRDPGNLGTIIRIADWFGISQIICSEESADVYNPKVVQSTMGSIGRVVVQYTDLAAWLATQDSKAIYATALAGKDITTMNKINEGVIIIGNESKGISPAIMQLAGVKITIPQKGKAESLNAAVAAGIILSHLV